MKNDKKKVDNLIGELSSKLSTLTIKSKFADSNDSIKYVTDMSNDRIVWVNETAKLLFGEVIGKKCHVVLQGLNKPCDFCTNKKLKPGEVYTWKHYNVKLGKEFLVRDFFHEINGVKYRFENAIDMTKYNKL